MTNDAGPQVLWSVEVERGDEVSPLSTFVYESVDQKPVEDREIGKDVRRRTYDRLRGPGGDAAIRVVVDVSNGVDRVVFSGRVENGEPNCRVISFDGPRFGPEAVSRGKDMFYYPYADGLRIRRFPTVAEVASGQKRFGFFWRNRGDGILTYAPELVCEYPSRRATMQWMTLSDGERGVAYVVKDPRFSPKRARVEFDPKTSKLAFSFQSHLFLRRGESFDLPRTDYVRYRGGWQVPSLEYGKWFSRTMPFAEVPAAEMDCTTLMLLICKQQNGRMVWPFTDFAALADALDAYGITNLKILGRGPGGHDNLYPDYAPDPAQGGEKALREGLALLSSRGIRTYAYVNGQLIEHEATDYWRNGGGRTAGVLKRNGERAGEAWIKYKDGPRHLFDVACPWDRTWLRRMQEVADDAVGLGFDGLYMDQTGKQWPWQCFDAHHGHKVGEWVWTQDRIDYLRGIHERTTRRRPDFILTSEGFCEPIAGSCAIHLGLRDHGSVVSRFDEDAWEDKWPEMTFLAMPRYITSDRFPSPTRSRTDVNGTAVVNYRVDLEVRYPTDRIVFERCVQTDYAEYGNLVSPPCDYRDFPKTDFRANRDYMRTVNAFRRAHRDILLRGDFKDDLGVKVVTTAKDWIAKRWVSVDGKRAGVLVWNADAVPRRFVVHGEGKSAGAYEPEAGAVEAETAIPANSLRLYRYVLVRE